MTLPLDFNIVARIETQLANSVLAGSELFAIGGATSVRGYDNIEAIGEKGFLTSLEIRSPNVGPIRRLAKKAAAQDNLQFLAFIDYGGVKSRTNDISTTLLSVGPGVHAE